MQVESNVIAYRIILYFYGVKIIAVPSFIHFPEAQHNYRQ